jgi:iron-sulfur cluster repair protein YtfE (RIC family)
MFRFTDLLRGGEIVREVKQKYPNTEAVFERYGVRPACYDCTINEAARRAGAPLGDLLAELNQLIRKKTSIDV